LLIYLSIYLSISHVTSMPYSKRCNLTIRPVRAKRVRTTHTHKYNRCARTQSPSKCIYLSDDSSKHNQSTFSKLFRWWKHLPTLFITTWEIRYIAATSINSKKGLKFSTEEDTKPE